MNKNAIGDARTRCPAAASRRNAPERAEQPSQAVKRIVLCIGKVVIIRKNKKANQDAYNSLKENLGIKDKELSRVDVLEIIAVRFAGILDGLAADVARNEANIRILDNNAAQLAKQIDDSEKKIKSQEDILQSHDQDLRLFLQMRHEG